MPAAQIALALFAVIAATAVGAAADTQYLMLETGGHTAVIKGLAFTPDGRHLVSAGDDKVIRVWDWQAGKTIRTIRGEVGPGADGQIYAIALSPDGRWLAAGGWMGPVTGNKPREEEEAFKIRLYDFATGKLAALLKGHTNVVNSLAFSLDGKRLISGQNDRIAAIIWDVEGQQIVHRLKGHKALVYAVAFSPDGERAVTASDTTLRLWRVRDGKLIAEMRGHKTRIDRALAVRSSDSLIASGDAGGEIRLWDGKTGRFLRTLARGQTGVGVLRFSPDGRWLLSGSTGGSNDNCHVWEVATGEKTATYEKHGNSVFAAAVSPDGRMVATGGGDHNEIHLWEPRTGETRRVLAGVGATKWAVAFSRDGRRIAWGATREHHNDNNRGPLELQLRLPDGRLGLGQPAPIDQDELKDLVRASPAHGAFALSARPEGAAGYNTTLDVKQDGRRVISIERGATNGDEHRSYAFTPDGQRVVSGGNTGWLSAHDLNGKLLGEFIGHESEVWAVAPAPDGRLLLSGSHDQTVRLWNLATRELIVTLFHGRNGEWVMWTPQGFYASSPNGGRLVGWQINKGPDQAAEYVMANQLRAHFYRPDIVESAIALASAARAVAEAPNADFTLAELRRRKPPAFAVISPTERSRASLSSTEIRVKLEPNDDPVEAIEVFVNSRQVTGRALREATARAATPGIAYRSLDVPLEQGENTIRIVARNQVGEAERNFVLFHDRPGLLDRRGTLHVLAIGVDRYPHLPPTCGPNGNQSCDLNYAGADARAFRDLMVKEAGPLYSDTRTLLLARDGDKPPTTANIKLALAEMLGKAGPEDTTILFVAGHGVNTGRGAQYLFLPEDAEPLREEWRESTVLPWSEFQNALQKTEGRRLIFADTCHSGGIQKAYNARLAADAISADIVVFSATDAATASLELPDLQHGAFTYALIHGLRDEMRRNDGSVTVLGLGAVISGRVAGLTGYRQKPTFHISGGGDFMLAATREAAARDASLREAATRDNTVGKAASRAVLAEEQARDPQVVDMLFATSRKPDISATNAVAFTHQRAEELSFGTLRVRIPKDRKIGTLPLPETRSWILFRTQPTVDENKHFILRDVTLLTPDSFIQTVRSVGRDEALVFVHGFNNTFEQAAFRLAQIAFDINYEGLRILFSWPSAGAVLGYRYDLDSTALARDLFVELLKSLQEKAGIKTVHIIAHSMGNELVLQALELIALQRLPMKVGELVMAAPDVSLDLFKKRVAKVREAEVAQGMTLYASAHDKALIASKTLALDVVRAGDISKEGPVVLPMMDTIDVSVFGDEFLGLNHNTFAANRSVMDDIGRLIGSSQRPPSKRTPTLRGRPEAMIPPKYWAYPR